MASDKQPVVNAVKRLVKMQERDGGFHLSVVDMQLVRSSAMRIAATGAFGAAVSGYCIHKTIQLGECTFRRAGARVTVRACH